MSVCVTQEDGQLCFTCVAVTDRCVLIPVKVGEEDSRWSCKQRVLDEKTDPESAAGVNPDIKSRYLKRPQLLAVLVTGIF